MTERLSVSPSAAPLTKKPFCLASGLCVFAILLAAPLIVSGNVAADVKFVPCEGNPNPHPHEKLPFRFETDSAAARGSNGKREFRVCVRNTGSDDIQVTWYVPGFDFWVLGGQQRGLTRTRNDLHAHSVTGCLKYGNRGEKTYAEFLGTITEQRYSAEQVQNECKGLGVHVTPAPPDEPERTAGGTQAERNLHPIHLEYELNFPSDRKRAAATMLSFFGKVDLKPLSDTSYRAQLHYGSQRPQIVPTATLPMSAFDRNSPGGQNLSIRFSDKPIPQMPRFDLAQV